MDASRDERQKAARIGLIQPTPDRQACGHPANGAMRRCRNQRISPPKPRRIRGPVIAQESRTEGVSVKPAPTREALVVAIESAGSGDADFFEFPEREDGLYLQQDPEEFAAFVHYMATKAPPAKLTLDIGIASGGQTKFLRDYFRAEKTIVVDIGQHPQFVHWPRIKQTLNTDLILEIIGDSHASATRRKLLPYRGQVDFAYVDGDHSYRGLRKDIFLAKEMLRPGGLMVLHDTLAAPGCKRAHADLLESSHFGLVRNFQNRFGISIWRMQKFRPPTALNRAFGVGRL